MRTDISNTNEKSTKIKALLNGTDVVNEEQLTKVQSACIAKKLKL